MSDEPELTPDQERSMWRRLASSPYVTEEERINFTLRAYSVANTSGERGRLLAAAIDEERERRRRGVTTVTPLPPGLCVSHSLNATAHVEQAEQLTSSATHINTVPGFQFRDVSWDRLPPPQKANANVTELARLLGQIFSGGVTAISFSQNAESPRAKLSFEISLPADITYDDVMANLQRLAGEHSSAKVSPNTGRRRLLKLEEAAT